MSNPFSAGVVVYFRSLDNTNTLARSVHMNGRTVVIQDRNFYPDDYVVMDDQGVVVGVYPREWVACILPLQTVGPANVPSEPPRHSNPSEAAAGDSEAIPGRAKRFDS